MTKYLNNIPSALIAIERSFAITFANHAAEILFGINAEHMAKKSLTDIPGFGANIRELCQRVFDGGEEISLFEQTLKLPLNHRMVTMHLTPVMGEDGFSPKEILITIEKADGLDHQAGSVWKAEGTRAAGVMAAMLAHEVKNPLSGIRGAAQLLGENATAENQSLVDLICKETDRIRDLLAQVEIFDNPSPEHMQPVNIHEVLQYVIAVAKTGFAPHVKFRELYDPSLPLVLAHRDLLVQLFLNLVKNAAEAIAKKPDATITLNTAYRSGARMHIGKSGQKNSLPIVVTVQDNGEGIPESIREHLFEPFISSKEDGRGLGLAVVAKIASDLGIVVELDAENRQGAKFNVMLPIE